MAIKLVVRGTAVGVLFSMMGCAVDVASPEPVELDMVEQAMPWRSNDAPSIFGSDLEYKLDALPREGEAAMIPWAGNYWPTYQDNINHRWAGEASEAPSTKYGLAFGVTGVEDAVSKSNGIDSQSNRTACTADDQCKENLGEVCAKREGKDSGYCVATWFGICHAWAPVALMYPEPKHEVVRNGVTFKVNDIKALLTLAHDKGLRNKFASGRCNDNDKAGGIQYDEHGRPLAEQCIDTNPASYHILLANYLGTKKQSFVEDRTYDFEVWNQPIRGFKVTKLQEVTAQEANRLIGVREVDGSVPVTYKFNDAAVKFYEVRTQVKYISESNASTDGNLASTIDRYTHTDRYTYVLEVDAEGKLIGGEWTGASKKNHVDFVWLPTEVTEHTIAGGKLKLANIMSLYRDSVREGEETVENRVGAVAARAWQHYGPFDVPAGRTVRVTMAGTGDADLYVRGGAEPTNTSYDCRPYEGDSSEECNVVSNGPVYVSVYGYKTSQFQLEIRF